MTDRNETRRAQVEGSVSAPEMRSKRGRSRLCSVALLSAQLVLCACDDQGGSSPPAPGASADSDMVSPARAFAQGSAGAISAPVNAAGAAAVVGARPAAAGSTPANVVSPPSNASMPAASPSAAAQSTSSAAPKRTRPPAGIDIKALATRPAQAARAGNTLGFKASPLFTSVVIAQERDAGDALYTWSANVGGHRVACAEVDDDETGIVYFAFTGYVSTWDDGSKFAGDLLITVRPDKTYTLMLFDVALRAKYTFQWRPLPPPSVDPKKLGKRPANAVLVNVSTVINRIETFQPDKVVKHWSLGLPCYTWTVEINGREVWCAEVVDAESGYSYFFYDEYECTWDDGSTFVGDLLVSVAPDESYDVSLSDSSEHVIYNIGEVNSAIFVDESTNYTIIDDSTIEITSFVDEITSYIDESTSYVDESASYVDESASYDDESESYGDESAEFFEV